MFPPAIPILPAVTSVGFPSTEGPGTFFLGLLHASHSDPRFLDFSTVCSDFCSTVSQLLPQSLCLLVLTETMCLEFAAVLGPPTPQLGLLLLRSSCFQSLLLGGLLQSYSVLHSSGLSFTGCISSFIENSGTWIAILCAAHHTGWWDFFCGGLFSFKTIPVCLGLACFPGHQTSGAQARMSGSPYSSSHCTLSCQ